MTKEQRKIKFRQAVASKMRIRREELGLTQKVLAERVGTSDTYIATIETGKQNVSFDMLAAIFTELGCDVLESLK